jgi:amino acid transporter
LILINVGALLLFACCCFIILFILWKKKKNKKPIEGLDEEDIVNAEKVFYFILFYFIFCCERDLIQGEDVGLSAEELKAEQEDFKNDLKKEKENLNNLKFSEMTLSSLMLEPVVLFYFIFFYFAFI